MSACAARLRSAARCRVLGRADSFCNRSTNVIPARSLLLASLLASTSVAVAHAATPAPVRMQVVAHEYSFTLSRLKVHSGPALIELDNMGQDPHDLRVQRAGSRHIAGLGVIKPGSRATLSLNLPPGRYSFWCSVANHRALGMQATVIVTR